MDLGLKSSIQWICREWDRKLDSNELGNNYNGFRWKERKYGLVLSKKKCPRHSPRRSILVYIYIYISFEFGYKSYSSSYSVFLFLLQSPSPRVFFLFYTILLSSPPSTCRPSCWLWSLSHQYLPEFSRSSCKVENHCSGLTSTLM